MADLVVAEVRQAIEERMAAVVALIDGLYLEGGALDGGAGADGGGVDDAGSDGAGADGGGEGARAAEDAMRLEEARSALKSVRQMLNAFASIDSVRELLAGLIEEAAAKLETAERRRAEAQGRLAMAGTLQQALRSVGAHLLGANYNVVREVLALPAVMAAAQEDQRRRQQQLVLAHNAELSALSNSPANALAVRLESEARERHESALREHTLRSDAANAAWSAHLQATKERLRVRDEQLIAAEGAALCAKVGTTIERLCAEPAYADLSRKALTPHEVDVAATLLRTLPPLKGVKGLVLSGNPFGDAAIIALADAGLAGALPVVERLFLDSVTMSDSGLAQLAKALRSGALPALSSLDLTRNKIDDLGVAALADAFRGGALANLRTLYLYNNQIGSEGLVALVEAFCSLETPPALEKLYLDNNQIRAPGVAALCAAIDAGRLPHLASLHLSGNPAGADAVERAVQSVQRQAEARGAEPRIRPMQQTSDIELPPVE